MLDSRQNALKLVANTMYGYTAANFSGRMPCNTIADAIVGHARSLTERSAAEIKSQFNLDTVYGDTDSVFVDLQMSLNRHGSHPKKLGF